MATNEKWTCCDNTRMYKWQQVSGKRALLQDQLKRHNSSILKVIVVHKTEHPLENIMEQKMNFT